MANRSRKRKPVQAGVEAIFTRENEPKAGLALAGGVLGIGAGGAAWTWSMIQASPSTSLLSLSMLLVISGIGLAMYSFAVRRSRRETERLRSALYELELLSEPKNEPVDMDVPPYPNGVAKIGNSSPARSKTLLGVVIAETLALVAFYGGLVQEYASNVNMQQWVRSSIWPAAYILNYNSLFLVVGGLLGTATFQVLSRKRS